MSCASCKQFPWLYHIHCIAYNLKLAVLDGIKEKNKLSSIKEIIYSINKHYHYSPSALRVLKEHAEFWKENKRFKAYQLKSN